MQTSHLLPLLLFCLAIKANASPLSLNLPLPATDPSTQLPACDITVRSTDASCGHVSNSTTASSNGAIAVKDFVSTIRAGIEDLEDYGFLPNDFRYAKVQFEVGPEGNVTAISDVRLFALGGRKWHEATFSKDWKVDDMIYSPSNATAPLDVDYMAHRGAKINVDVAYRHACIVAGSRKGRLPWHEAQIYTSLPEFGHQTFYVFQYVIGQEAGKYIVVNFRDGVATFL